MSYETPAGGFRTFLILWSTQSFSVFGTAVSFFSLTIWLTQVLYPRPSQKPELGLALAALGLAFSIPTVFGAPLAGAWVDRHDRKLTMIAMDVANGLLSLILAGLLFSNTLQLWMLVAITACYSLCGIFHSSAFDTSYAMIVPERQLPRATGMMQTMMSMSGILSPTIAVAAIILGGIPLAIAFDAFTFFLVAAVLPFLYIPSPKRTDLIEESGRRKSTWSDVKEGAMYIWRRKPLLWLLGTFTVVNFASAPLGVLEPLITKFNLASDWTARGFTFETAFALLASASAIGGVAGGVFVSAWGGLKTKRVYGVVLPMIILGVAQVLFGLSPFLYLAAAMVFAVGSMVPIMNSHSTSIWQTQTPRELQGRVFAVRRLIAQFTWPLSTALAGWAGGIFNPGIVIAILGAFLAIFCIGQMFNPHLLRVEDKEWLDQMATRAEAQHRVS